MKSSYHLPVLLGESINGLKVYPKGVYVDATFGGGGHSYEILKNLSNEGSLISFDQDPEAMSITQFREEILRERGVELYMEGHRFFDLTRFGVYDEYCRFVYGDTDGARQAEDYTWPIPIIETSTNSEID